MTIISIKNWYVWGCVAGFVLVSCNHTPGHTSQEAPTEEWKIVAPVSFPAIPFPEDNPATKAKWKLGKKLFFDPVLSEDFSVSCATCHLPSKAFSDGLALSKGVHGRTAPRNAPSLANVAYHPFYTREGTVPTLERQVLVPVQDTNELNMNIVTIARRLQQDSSYVRLTQEAFGRKPDAYTITRALATYERSLLSGNSRYDRALQGTAKLSEAQLSGKALFFSEETACSDCHGGFNFTQYEVVSNGLPIDSQDLGRFRLTLDSHDIGKFKTPSLRNVALTAPYMHDGRFATLDDVIEHYNSGGAGHPYQDARIKPLYLSDTEKHALIAFLHSLTDSSFVERHAGVPLAQDAPL